MRKPGSLKFRGISWDFVGGGEHLFFSWGAQTRHHKRCDCSRGRDQGHPFFKRIFRGRVPEISWDFVGFRGISSGPFLQERAGTSAFQWLQCSACASWDRKVFFAGQVLKLRPFLAQALTFSTSSVSLGPSQQKKWFARPSEQMQGVCSNFGAVARNFIALCGSLGNTSEFCWVLGHFWLKRKVI